VSVAPEVSTDSGRRLTPLRWALLAALLSGLLLVAAFPPLDFWLLAPVATAGLLATLRGRSVRGGALVGLVFGATFIGGLTPWLRVIGPDAWLAVVVLSALALAVFGAGATLLLELPGWPLWTAAWWATVESLRSLYPLGGFPWGRLAHSQVDAPSVGWVAIGGVPLLGFVVVLTGALLLAVLLAWQRGDRRTAAVAAVAGIAVYAGAALVPTPTDGRPVTVAVVQGNVPRTGMDAFGQREAVLTAHLEATHQLADDVRDGTVPRPDLVIWPENASDIDPALDADAYTRIADAVQDVGVPVLVGMVVEVEGGERVANQGTVWDPETGPGETYVKQNLVPFGEYVPFRSQLQPFISRLDRIPRDFVAGDRPGVLDLGAATVADVICFDVAYDDAVRDAVTGGGELITVQTNNATYGRTAQVEQQFAISRLRAIEHSRVVLVAATSGISGIIAPDGSVVEQTPEFVAQVLVAEVPARTSQTLATRFGPAVAWGLTAVGAAAVLAGAWRRRRAGTLDA
jgi:apolipoprotein N-acyltransferase